MRAYVCEEEGSLSLFDLEAFQLLLDPLVLLQLLLRGPLTVQVGAVRREEVSTETRSPLKHTLQISIALLLRGGIHLSHHGPFYYFLLFNDCAFLKFSEQCTLRDGVVGYLLKRFNSGTE